MYQRVYTSSNASQGIPTDHGPKLLSKIIKSLTQVGAMGAAAWVGHLRAHRLSTLLIGDLHVPAEIQRTLPWRFLYSSHLSSAIRTDDHKDPDASWKYLHAAFSANSPTSGSANQPVSRFNAPAVRS